MKKLDNTHFKNVKYIKINGLVKIVTYFTEPYYKVRLRHKENIYTDCFNDKEPYDLLTHFYFIDEKELTIGDELTLLLLDEEGEEYEYSFMYNPVFENAEDLYNEYNSKIRIETTEIENISDGVVYCHYFCKDKNDMPVHIFSLDVDMKYNRLYLGTPDDDYKCGGVIAKVPEMIDSAVKNGVKVVAAVNADFFDIYGDGRPSGLCIKNGKVIDNEDSLRPFIAMKKDGSAVVTTLKESPDIIPELECAAAGIEMIVKDGKIYEWGELEPFAYVRHPRTVAGIKKNGNVILLEVDGRIPDYSNGATLIDLAEMMIHLGADRAVNMDGGGSSVVYTKSGDEFILRSNPADLYRPFDKLIRDEYNSLLVAKKEG